MPKRGAIALSLTALALVLLLNFQDPSGMNAGGGLPSSRGAGTTVAGTRPVPGAQAPVPSTPAGAQGGAQDGAQGGGESGGPQGGGAQAPATGTGGGRTPATGNGGTQAGGQTVTGPAVDMRWGTVQVQVTVANGKITDITALQMPDGDRHSASISSRVEPVLRSQALQAQSANIDGVSGATYTSLAYARSLQAALDSAGI